MRNVNAIKEWFKNGKGREITRKLLPEQEQKIGKYLNVPQCLNREEISGVYQFYFVKDNIKNCAYIGEAGNIYFRLLEHLYNLFNNITEWGVFPKDFLEEKIKIEWECEVGISSEEIRRKIEKEKSRRLNLFCNTLKKVRPNTAKIKSSMV